MLINFRTFALALLLIASPYLVGCNDEGGTEAEQLSAEQEDVQEAQEHYEDAQDNVQEQKEELADANEEVEEQRREHEEALDALGDAERQLEKEQEDLKAERNDVEPAPIQER